MSCIWQGLIFTFFTTTIFSHPVEQHKSDCLIIILVDGVRWDYVNDTSLVGFQNIAKHGVRAEYVDPIFPANSYPNWYTIVTGRYAENHSFVQNYMFDKLRNDYFEMAPSPNASHVHWWNGSQPLWITAEKHGIKTEMYWWDGCQVTLDNTTVSYCKNYISYKNFDVKNSTDEALSSILDSCKEGKRLGLVYYEPVDGKGHEYGPDSEERKTALKEIDSILEKFQENMENKNLSDKVNLVVVSDHGMASSYPVKSINISQQHILENIEIMLDRGSMSMIMPKKDKMDELYDNLTTLKIEGLHIYKKRDIPDRYHFKKNDLVLPILLVADKGYFIERIPGDRMHPDSNTTYRGFHGYDPNNTDMRGIFYARGPGFKEGFVAPPLNMVDHYQVFCHLLGIQALPNNGNWEKVKDMIFSNSAHSFHIKYLTLFSIAFHLLIAASI